MAQRKTTVDKSEIKKRVRAKKAKRNITFSLPEDLLEKFSASVEKDKLTMTDVVEQLIKSYLGISEK
jgi:metal-responsive CopG/Arc/MetJ family transcriptional regulator